MFFSNILNISFSNIVLRRCFRTLFYPEGETRDKSVAALSTGKALTTTRCRLFFGSGLPGTEQLEQTAPLRPKTPCGQTGQCFS
jgi:hypothetical protein